MVLAGMCSRFFTVVPSLSLAALWFSRNGVLCHYALTYVPGYVPIMGVNVDTMNVPSMLIVAVTAVVVVQWWCC